MAKLSSCVALALAGQHCSVLVKVSIVSFEKRKIRGEGSMERDENARLQERNTSRASAGEVTK
jgi:hypothetical protein